jgi:hypothetical protein
LETGDDPGEVFQHMRKFAIFLLLTLGAIAMSQEMPPARDIMIMKRIFTIFRKGVKEELKITSAEDAKIKDAFGGALEVDGDKVMISLTGENDFDDMCKKALKALDEDQQKRLIEIWIQSLQGAALGDDEIAKKVDLTDDQKKGIGKLIDDAGAKILELFSPGSDPGEEGQKKSEAIRKEAGQKMVALLTDDQKKKYEALKGKEFKFEKS